MKVPELIADGKPLPLGKRIGRGGEGDVYLVDDGTLRAVKFYTISDPTTRELKIKSMVENRLSAKTTLAAFPLATASLRDGRFAGFLMNLVSGHKPLYEIYSPGARKKNFPRADYRFLVRAASNIARAVGSVHQADCVIGDINHSGILVSDKATAALIDADSFQYSDGNRQFLCKVGVPEYTPPELQGKKLSETVRTREHDAFGLAIVIFQMLCMGRHPFVGTYSQGEMPIERAIREHRFAYSLRRNSGMTPPPGAVLISDFPKNIAHAFEIAFGQTQARPSAEHWVSLLSELEQSLKQCGKNDLHYYPATAPECIWCRMELRLGITLFLPDFTQVKYEAVTPKNDFDLAGLWAQIEKVPLVVGIHPVLPPLDLMPSQYARDIKNEEKNVKIFAVVITVAAIVFVLCFPKLYFISGGVALFGLYRLSQRSANVSNIEERFKTCNDNWNKAIREWEKKCGVEELYKLKDNLIKAKHSYETLAQERARRLAVYQTKRREEQLQQFLESHPIRSSKIKGVGPARQAALASFGIDTAAECTFENLLKVPGFGTKNSVPLITWREKLKHKFIYDDQVNAGDHYQIRAIDGDMHLKALKLKTMLISGASNLAMLSNKIRTASQTPDPEIFKLHKMRCQLAADLEYLGKPVSLQITKSNP